MVRAFRHELLKLRRPTMLLGTLGVLTAVAVLGVVVTLARAGSGEGGVSIASLSQPDGFATMMQRGVELLGIAALGIVAIAVGQDYSTGMLRSMLMREPRRLRLLAGKIAADLAFSVSAVVLALAVGFGAALLLGPSRGVDTSQWLHAGLATTLAEFGAVALAALGFGVFGAALAIVLRSPAAAVMVGVAWSLPVEGLLGRIWSDLDRWLPVHQLSVIADRGQTASLGTALLIAGGYVATAALVFGTLFRRSDVTA
jgi:ABC-2 type transport system permease protein